MNSAREWPRWALRMADLHRLPDGEARMLCALAAHANAGGETFAHERTLAKAVGRSERQARRLLAGLRARGLVLSLKQGPGRAMRVLKDVVPTEQLTFEQVTAETPDPVPAAPVDGAVDRTDMSGHGGACPAIQGVRDVRPSRVSPRSQQKEQQEEEARENGRSSGGSADGLADTLDAVLAVLKPAPGLDIEPLSLNAILLGLPEAKGYDHVRGAQTVASWAYEGGLWARAANRLLERALLKQTEPGRVQANRITPPTAPRGRGGQHGSTVARGDALLADLVNGGGIG